ncbi:MAG: hypothetical protein L6R38_005636 [Xanthoria sp. 2 TBL-2021]|nr:MAG: hypothetical protein L6R38_005636 [Xanthoria sp. 2 TBL-2021]
MYSLGVATPFWLSGRIHHYGPVAVLLSSCSSTRGAFSCDFVVLYSASSKRSYNRAKPRKVQRLITWYDPTTLAKDEQTIDDLQGSLSLKRNAGAAWSITPVVTVYSLSDDNGERHTSKATAALSYANAGTQTNSSTDTNGDRRINTSTTLPGHNDEEHLTISNHLSVQHVATCNVSMSPVTTVLSISGPANNILTDSQVGYPGSEMLEHDTVATIDRSEVNFLLTRIAELEGIVAQQRTQIEEQAAQAVHNQSQDTTGDKIWANRSTTLVEEVDAAAWAEAALVSRANTLADKEQFAMQQNASIGRLQAVVGDQDRTIKAQDSTISDLQARRLRGAFKYAETASKDSANAKQLQEELQAEKAARAADAQKAQADIAIVKAYAAEALAALKRQSETEMVTVMKKHQIEVSKSTASQSQAETKIQGWEDQVPALKQEDLAKGKRITKLTSELESTINKYHGAASRMQKAEKALEARKDECQREKKQLMIRIDETTRQLTEAEIKVKSLQKEVKDLEETDECRVSALDTCLEEADEKDEEIITLKAENEQLKTGKKSLSTALSEKAREATSLKADNEALKAQYKKTLSSTMTMQQSAEKEVSKRDTKIKELDAANKKTHLENAALIVTINPERARHDERHEADIRSLQRDVFSRDQRLRDFENKMEALRSQLVRAYEKPICLTIAANLCFEQSTNAVSAVSPGASPTPTSPSSVHAPKADSVSRSITSPTSNGPVASSIPLPLSPTLSQASVPSSASVHSSPPLVPAAAIPPPQSSPGSEVSLIDIGLPSEHSFSDELASEMGFSSPRASEASEPEVIDPDEVEEPLDPLPQSFRVDDGIEVENITSQIDFLTTAAVEGQRLITWPYGIPTLRITWHEGKISEALPSNTGEALVDTEGGVVSPSASMKEVSGPGTKDVEKTSSTANQEQTQEDGDKIGDQAHKDPSSIAKAATTPFDTARNDIGSSTAATPAQPPGQVSATADVASQEPLPSSFSSSSANQPEANADQVSPGQAPVITSPAFKGKSVESEQPSAESASNPPPPQPIAAVGTLPKLVEPTSSDKKAEVINDKSDQLKGEAVGLQSPSSLVLQLTTRQPRRTISDGGKDKVSGKSANPEETILKHEDGAIPDAGQSEDVGDHSKAKEQPAQAQANSAASNTNLGSVFADGTLPTLVQNNSSNGKQPEDVHDNGDEPMGEAVGLQSMPSTSQQLTLIQPRDTGLDDGDFEMDDAAPQTAMPQAELPVDFDQEMFDAAIDRSGMDFNFLKDVDLVDSAEFWKEVDQKVVAMEDASSTPAAESSHANDNQMQFHPTDWNFSSGQAMLGVQQNDAFFELDSLMETIKLDPASEPAACNSNSNQFCPPSGNFSFDQPMARVQPTVPTCTGFGPAPPGSPQQPLPGIGQGNVAPNDVNMDFSDLLRPVHAWNEFDNQSNIPAVESQFGFGPSSQPQFQGQAPAFSGSGQSNNAQPSPFSFGNGNQTGDLPMANGFSSGQNTPSAQQPVFQGAGAFGQQVQQPTHGAGQTFNIEEGMHQTMYPDPTGMGLAPSNNVLWAPGPQSQNSFTNSNNGGMGSFTSNEQGTVDDLLTFALNQQSLKRLPNKKKPLPKGVLEKKKPLPKRVVQLSGSVKASASESKPTLQSIFAPYMNKVNGNTNGESSDGGVGNDNPFIGVQAQDWNFLRQQPVQFGTTTRDNSFNQAYGNHNNDNACIDPQLLSLDPQQQWQPSQPQQSSTNEEPEVLISPASPTESEALSAEYESEDDDDRMAALFENGNEEENGDWQQQQEHGFSEPVEAEHWRFDSARPADETHARDYSPPIDSDIINPFSGEPWKPGELLGDNGNEKDGSTPIEYEISPFSGKPFPKPRTQSSSPATPPSTNNSSSNSPEQRSQSTQHTTPEKALSSPAPNHSPEKEYSDKGKGKETLQPSEGVPPEQRILNPIRRRRLKPAAADFFEAPPEKPFIVTVEGDDDDGEDDRKKKRRPSSDFISSPHTTSSSPSSSLSPEPIPDNPVPNCITKDDEPAESPVFNDKTMFQPPPSTSTSYTEFLNQTVAAQRQVKAALPNPKDDIESDEDEEVDFEDCIPAEPTPGSKGNGYGKKRRGSEDDFENWTDARVSGYGEKENQAPCFDPSALKNLSPEQLGGSVSVIGMGPSTSTRPQSHTDLRARYVPSRPWENPGTSPLPGLGGPTARGGPS